MGDLVKLIRRQLQLQEPVHLNHRIPQGIIRAVGHPLRAVSIDVLFRHARFHKHQGAGYIKETIRVLQVLVGLSVNVLRAEMGGDDLQTGEHFQHLEQTVGV